MKNSTHRLKYIGLECGLAFALLYLLLAGIGKFQSAQAYPGNGIFTVTTTGSGGNGSLRQAIHNANLNPGADKIVFAIPGCSSTSPCVISLQNQLPVITDSVMISGTGAASLIIDANNSFRGLNVGANAPVSIADLTVQHGNTPGRGAGIRSFSALTLTRVHLLHNQAGDAGGGVYAADGLRVIGGHFAHNTSLNHGGGLHNDSRLVLESTEFISNTAYAGGGASGGNRVLITGGRFERNYSSSEGGGLLANDTLSLTGTVFLSNTASGLGGGLAASDAWVSQAWIENNQSDGGGGIYAEYSLILENSHFTRNRAEGGRGGGAYTWYAALTNTTFTSNTAVSSGGGLVAYGDVHATQSRFEGNAGEDGGGIYVFDAPLNLTDVTFLNNRAGEDGGGAFVIGPVTATASLFENNQSHLDGGGLMGLGSIRTADTLFTGNTAQNGRGGGLFVSIPNRTTGSGNNVPENATTAILSRTHFLSNTAMNLGGGAAVNVPLALNASTFTGNFADRGGGLYHGVGAGLVINTLFAKNRATSSGTAVVLDSPDPVSIAHTTIVGDSGLNRSGVSLGMGSLTLLNSIVAHHGVGIRNLNGIVNQDFTLFFQNNVDIDGNYNGGAHSLQGDPKFVSPAANDFHLSAGSAALDIGADIGIPVDFENQTRPLGGGFDIGFDEADLITGLGIAFSPGPTTTTDVPTAFTATITGGSDVSYVWDFGDGSPSVSGTHVVHSYAVSGTYSVTVTATNSSGSVSVSTTVAVVPGAIAPSAYRIFLPIVVR